MIILLQEKKQAIKTDCLECRVFEDPNDTTRVMLLWPATSSLIVEEHISAEVFNDFTVEVPLLLWVQGSMDESFDSVLTDHQFTDLSSLNNRNTSAISAAIVDLRSIGENNNTHLVSDVISVLTDDKDLAAERIFAATLGSSPDDPAIAVVTTTTDNKDMLVLTGSVGSKVGSAHDYDGNEEITVHTEMTPLPVLTEERQLVDYLGALYDPKRGIKERQLKVGGHLVTVQTFHYPALNIEAPCNKRLRTYVNKENLPLLYSYDAKEAMTLMINSSIPASGCGSSRNKVLFLNICIIR